MWCFTGDNLDGNHYCNAKQSFITKCLLMVNRRRQKNYVIASLGQVGFLAGQVTFKTCLPNVRIQASHHLTKSLTKTSKQWPLRQEKWEGCLPKTQAAHASCIFSKFMFSLENDFSFAREAQEQPTFNLGLILT